MKNTRHGAIHAQWPASWGRSYEGRAYLICRHCKRQSHPMGEAGQGPTTRLHQGWTEQHWPQNHTNTDDPWTVRYTCSRCNYLQAKATTAEQKTGR